MPEAEYTGSAARYMIGPHVFEKDKPESLKQTVDEGIAKFLRENPDFAVDGKGGKRVAKADEPEDSPTVPAEGFKSRDAAIAFAEKWLPKLDLDPKRSTAELQRRIEAELLGRAVDKEGEVLAVQSAGPTKVEKAEPKVKVPV